MNQNICFNCGNPTAESDGLFVCPACGAVMPEGVSDKEAKMLLFAFDLLDESRFDEAQTAFEEIIRQYPYHPEAYFGRLRARYHITYVKTIEEKLVPRCPTRSGANIFEDVDYRSAMACADEAMKSFLQAQAEHLKAFCTESVSSKNVTYQFNLGDIDPNEATVIPRKVSKTGIWISLFLAFTVLLATMTGYDRNWKCETPTVPTLAEVQKEEDEEN